MIVIEQKEKLFAQKPYEFIDDTPPELNSSKWKRNVKIVTPKLMQSFTRYGRVNPKRDSRSFDATSFCHNDSRKNNYYGKIETLINRCKESELEMQTINVNKTKRQQLNKELNNVSWAVKEYLTGITGKTWMKTANIKSLLAIRKANKKLKKLLFTPELIDSIRTNMTRRAVAMTSLGQKSIWKPPRYIPSRQVVLANSMEELNNLYQVDGYK